MRCPAVTASLFFCAIVAACAALGGCGSADPVPAPVNSPTLAGNAADCHRTIGGIVLLTQAYVRIAGDVFAPAGSTRATSFADQMTADTGSSAVNNSGVTNPEFAAALTRIREGAAPLVAAAARRDVPGAFSAEQAFLASISAVLDACAGKPAPAAALDANVGITALAGLYRITDQASACRLALASMPAARGATPDPSLILTAELTRLRLAHSPISNQVTAWAEAVDSGDAAAAADNLRGACR